MYVLVRVRGVRNRQYPSGILPWHRQDFPHHYSTQNLGSPCNWNIGCNLFLPWLFCFPRMPHLPLGFPLPQCLVWESPHREIQNSTALELYSFFRVFGASTCLYSGLCCTQVTLGHGVTLVSGSAYARGVYTRRRHVWKLPSLVSHQTQDPKTLQCRVRKGAGRQSAVKCVSTYSGRLVSARHLYSATVEPGKAAQLCVFILGMRYFYLGVLSLCLGMGVPYILVSNMWHFAF